jgi:hypothetical protein
MYKKVIAQLHGINTTAKWQGTFSDAAQYVGWKSDLKRWYYGKFSVFRFLLPWQRSSKVYWFRNTYTELKYDKSFAKDLDDDHPPSIVAHSFGTYIPGYSLVRFPNIKFDKVIVCGSILPKDFPWDELLERGQVIAIRNEYGTADIWSDITRWFVKGTGPSGKTGFDCRHSRLIQQEFSTFRHSDYFERGHMDSFWIPFIGKEVSAEFHRTSPTHLPRASIPWGLYAI